MKCAPEVGRRAWANGQFYIKDYNYDKYAIPSRYEINKIGWYIFLYILVFKK